VIKNEVGKHYLLKKAGERQITITIKPNRITNEIPKLVGSYILKETYPLRCDMQNKLDYSASNIQPTTGDLSVQYPEKIVIQNYQE